LKPIENTIALDNVNIKKSGGSKHIPSTIQADTLFTFTNQLEWLINSLKSAMLSPRYCEENISYLKIKGIKRMAYPMKCFCDINMHMLNEHLEWYGYYGLAFSKEWGMNNKIQPVQYINPDSLLRKDFSTAFYSALKEKATKQSISHQKLKDYILHEMMYYKPYSGKIKNRLTGISKKKCFTDECEWRFIPDVSSIEYQPVIFDEDILNAGTLVDISNSMDGIANISIKYDYTDIKYIIVKTIDDFERLAEAVVNLKLQQKKEHELISKIIVWDKSRRDF